MTMEIEVAERLLNEWLLSPAVADVNRLALLLERGHRPFGSYRSSLRIVTTKFVESSEDLTLSLSLNTAWCDRLGNLGLLRRIKWIAAAEEVVDSSDPTEVPMRGGEVDAESLEERAVTSPLSVFGSRDREVEVIVWVLNEAEYMVNWGLDL